MLRCTLSNSQVLEDVVSDGRRSQFGFAAIIILRFASAPVTYVGIVQAALCQKLGASIAISNLPLSVADFGSIVPLVVSLYIPYRFERVSLIWCHVIAACSVVPLVAALLLPASNHMCIGLVIGQSLLYGFVNATQTVYLYQCLRRSCSERGRLRALKIAFSCGPLVAVLVASPLTHFLLAEPRYLHYPRNYAVLYLFAGLCFVASAIAACQFRIQQIPEIPRPGLFVYLRESIVQFFSARTLILLWLACFLSNSSLSILPNLSLNAKNAVGFEVSLLVGIMFALHFGFKSVAGFVLARVGDSYGSRAPLIVLTATGIAVGLWACSVRGYAYLLVFGLMGAAELGGAYFSHYCVSASSAENGVKNLSVLNLAYIFSSFAAVTLGSVAARFGFNASFLVATFCSLAALLLSMCLPGGRSLATNVSP